MSQVFIIQGGKTLKGSIDVYGSKNATTPILAASLLSKEPSIISNIPLIEDVLNLLNIIESMGAKIT
jgi:UDP-N-acetylglucosamine 1-carboxyvinyltransferase